MKNKLRITFDSDGNREVEIHGLSEEDVAIEMLKDTSKEMINDLEAKLKHETEKGEKDEEDEE